MQAVAYDLVLEAALGTPVYRSVSQEGPGDDRFIVMVWEQENVFAGATGEYPVQIWVYDQPGDYGWIDATISAIREMFLAAYDRDGSDGGHFTSARWNGRSADLYDDVFRRITRNCVITIAGHQ